jgi:hypothetical protein
MSASVSPTTSPPGASRIWSGVLVVERWRPNIRQAVQPRRRAPETLGDLVDVTHAVDLAKEATLTVDGREWRRLLDVDVQPVPDHVFGVIGAAIELGALEQTLDHLVGVHAQLEDCVQAGARSGEHLVKLVTCARVRG